MQSLKCPKCNAPNKPNSKYCTFCGTELDLLSLSNICNTCSFPIKPGTKYCPNCGDRTNKLILKCINCGCETRSTEAKFCNKCGSPLDNQIFEKSLLERDGSNNLEKCKNCGTKLLPGERYCVDCGIKIK